MRLSAVFALPFALGAIAVERKRIPLSSLADQCRIDFKEARISFNLCPLLKDHGHLTGVRIVEEDTPPTITTTTYSWNLAGPLARNESIPEDEQCPPGTWFCKIVANKHPSKDDTRIVQIVPIAGELSEHVPEATHIDPEASLEDPSGRHDVLYIRLYGGFYGQKRQNALIDFRCDTEVSEPTEPKFAGSWQNTHLFRWATRHACATGQGVYQGKPDDDKKSGDNDDDPPSFGGGGPKFAHRRPWAWRLAWFSAGALLLGLLYAVHTRRMPVRVPSTAGLKRATRALGRWHPLGPLYRRFTFRVGEDVLVRWAREEEDGAYLGLDSLETNADSNYNIRGASIFVADPEEGRFVGEDDEMIPLHPSPRKGGVRRYI